MKKERECVCVSMINGRCDDMTGMDGVMVARMR